LHVSSSDDCAVPGEQVRERTGCLNTGQTVRPPRAPGVRRIVTPMPRRKWFRATATYLLLFFLAVVAAPHHHVNGLEDFLLDQPSDSGCVVENGGPIGTRGAPAYDSFWLVVDDPCLACFSNDFVAAPVPSITFVARLERRAIQPEPASKKSPDPVPQESPSRAPPALS
jgi:hypothetical protein